MSIQATMERSGAPGAPGFDHEAMLSRISHVYLAGDRILGATILMHSLLAFVFASFHDTWTLAITVTFAVNLLFWSAYALIPGTLPMRLISGLALQSLCMLFIYQLHGLMEMHFFFFTSCAIMIVYADWRCLWLGVLALLALHTTFAVLHNQGADLNFFEEPYVTARKLCFHYGIVLFHAGICSYWSFIFARRKLADAHGLERLATVERQTAAREQFLTSLVDSSPSAILVFGQTGYVTFANQTAVNVFGHGSDSVRGANYQDFLEPRSAQHCVMEHNRALGDGKSPGQEEILHIRGEEEPRHFHVERFLLEDPNSRATLLCFLAQDRSDTVRAKTVIEEQRVRLMGAARLSVLGEMAGGIAHEINNPLAIIKGSLQQLRSMLEDPGCDRKRVLEKNERALRTTDRIAKIVRGLRNFARDGQKDPCKLVPVREIVNDTLELCLESLVHKGIRVSLPEIPDTLMLYCRETEISQVLLNLLSNAKDAVAAVAPERRWVRVEVDDEPQVVRFAVSDGGPGIPEELRERILVPFFTTKSAGEGTGLGLSISKAIAESHDGSLSLDPSSGFTRFVLTLPKSPPRT